MLAFLSGFIAGALAVWFCLAIVARILQIRGNQVFYSVSENSSLDEEVSSVVTVSGDVVLSDWARE